jgi:hypothetical protein
LSVWVRLGNQIPAVIFLTIKIRRERQTLILSNAACHQQMLLTGGKKFKHAYKGSRSQHASAIQSNLPGFRKQKLGYFSNRLVRLKTVWTEKYRSTDNEIKEGKNGKKGKNGSKLLWITYRKMDTWLSHYRGVNPRKHIEES